MIGVGEDDAGAELLERVLRQSFYSGGCADRHECGRFECAVWRREFASAGACRVGLGNLERKAHYIIVAVRRLSPNSRALH